MLTKTDRRSGFTIVELLIVIVVIGILAAISTVAYNGIKERAANSATVSGAVNAQKILNFYMNQEGSYATTTTNYCLTVDNKCLNTDGSVITLDNSTLITTLQKVGKLPASVPNNWGLRYSYQSARTLNGQPMPAAIVYRLKGANANCGIRTVISNGGTADYMYTTTNYTTSTATETQCIIPLQDPSSI